jgi:hypothetical protein
MLFVDVTGEVYARLLQIDNIQVGYILLALEVDPERLIEGLYTERRLITD